MKNTKPNFLRFFLILFSLLFLLFTGWIGIKGPYRESFKIGVARILGALDNHDDESFNFWGDASTDRDNLKAAKKFLKKFADGTISPLELAGMAPKLSRLITSLNSFEILYELDEMRYGLWIYTILFWLTVLLGIGALLLSITGSKRRLRLDLFYSIGLVLIFIAMAILAEELDGMSIRLWPFLTLVCGIGSLFVGRFSFAAGGPSAAGRQTAAGQQSSEEQQFSEGRYSSEGWQSAAGQQSQEGWQSAAEQQSAAGQQSSEGQPFQTAGGPARYCANCGAKLIPGAKFCTNCGQPCGNRPEDEPGK